MVFQRTTNEVISAACSTKRDEGIEGWAGKLFRYKCFNFSKPLGATQKKPRADRVMIDAILTHVA